jgi:tRNA-specific 2-thiouridylase
MFTIGQRKGLPGGSLRPRYVVDIDAETNRVIVGDVDELLTDDFEVDRVNWVSVGAPTEPREVVVKIRYSHPGTPATLTPQENGTALVQLHVAQKAVTPGQAAVFYDADVVIGGGWICRKAALVPA